MTAARNGTRPARVPPHSLDAERSLLGAMLITGDALAGGVDACTAADFYSPAYAATFHAMVGMYRQGEPVDAVTVADRLARVGQLDAAGGLVGLTGLMSDAPTTNAARYAAVIVRHALGRRLLALASDIAEQTYDGADPYDLAEQVQARTADLQGPVSQTPSDLTTWDGFLDRPAETYKPWVIPGILRVGWRVIVVAPESRGKTMVTSMIALCVSQGVHPFTSDPVDPIRTLFVDLENPDEHVDLRGKLLRQPLQAKKGDLYQAEQAWLWHRPGGMNIRSRSGRAALEAAIAHVRPQLVVIAPVYKMFRTGPKETDEMAAGEVQDILDNLRTRYQFALILEHHAPKGVYRARDMVPFGSSLWYRWPETGLALTLIDKGPNLIVDRYKPDRLPCRWPDELHRGHVWPWVGHYKDGVPRESLVEEERF